MSALKPMVYDPAINGPRVARPGDTLDIATSGGEQVSFTNDNTGALVIGTPVYMTASDHMDKGQANAAATAEVIGLVADVSIATGAVGNVQLNGIMSATTAQWDAVAGTTGGLTFGAIYYLSVGAAGQITTTVPATGNYYKLCVVGISATEGLIRITPTLPT